MKEKIFRKDTLATRASLIDAAEHLFAEQGVESTNLLDITKAAGQKNRCALQYHFNNKEGLINAVLDKHADGILKQSAEMLGKLEARHEYTLYEVAEAVVSPLAALLDSKDGGQHFLKIHRELMFSKKYAGFRKHRRSHLVESDRLLKVAERFFTDIDPDELKARIVLIDCLLINGLVAYLSEEIKISRSVYVKALTQGVVALVAQPSM